MREIHIYNLSGDILSGTSILSSELINNLSSDDYFLISEPQLPTAVPYHYFSKKLNYIELKNKMFNDIKSKFGFKSMAYENKDDYAKIDHHHSDYNKVAINLNDFDDDIDTKLIAVIEIDKHIYELNMPMPVMPPPPEPLPGQLKFVANPVYVEVDENSPTFDGWVHANGQQYKKSDFIYSDYFESASDSKFKVPHINKLIRMNPEPFSHLTNEVIPASNDFRLHSHYVDLQLNDTSIKGSFEYKIGHAHDSSSAKGTHGTSRKKEGNATTSLSLKVNGLYPINSDYIESVKDNDKTTHPAFNYLPVFVYIGKRKDQYND